MIANEGSAGEVTAPITKWCARFVPKDPIPGFIWRPPENAAINPARQSFTCANLLLADAFIDKSRALYSLLSIHFDLFGNDFRSTPLLLAYPRRFAKTTLLGFIEAVFTPLSTVGVYNSEKVKMKIAALERGKDLLDFGLHPVLRLDLHTTSTVAKLNDYIDFQLKLAGLDDVFFETTLSPAYRVRTGAHMLNAEFEAKTGVKTKTIVLIDEYDNPFRDRNRHERDPLLDELIELFSLGKEDQSGISLLILCGLTRMAGTGLSMLNNNLIDVSRDITFHGLCGISSRELTLCVEGQLDEATSQIYGDDTNFKSVLDGIFRKQWDGFRFGLNNRIGELDPNSADGALFSPIDIWEIVQSLRYAEAPSSLWIKSMDSEFAFTNFAEKYKSSPAGHFELYRNLEGGWVDTNDANFKLKREEYITLESDLHVKVVLFELGLLSVKEVRRNWVHLVSPNEMVLEKSMNLLLKETKQGITTKALAFEYLSESGFETIVNNAAKDVTDSFGGIGGTAVNEHTFQIALYKELHYRFLVKDGSKFNLYNEKYVPLIKGTKEKGKSELGRVDMAVALKYNDCPTLAFLIKVKFEKIATHDDDSIRNEHRKNLLKANDQIQTYDWIEPVNTIQRVGVSGIWHPSSDEQRRQSCELSSKVEFFTNERFSG